MSKHPLTEILLIRHTDVYNPRDILYGRLPRFGLSDLGRGQAENTAEALGNTPIDVFYTSPRLRARQTARIIAGRHPHAPMHTTRLLDEILTSWQGRPHGELEQIGFDFYSNPLDGSDEALEDLRKRVERFFTLARKRHRGQTTAAVSHGDPVMLARAMFLGMPIEVGSLRAPNVYPGKGSITRFRFGPDSEATYPLSVEYWDPNSDDPWWSGGFRSFDAVRKTA